MQKRFFALLPGLTLILLLWLGGNAQADLDIVISPTENDLNPDDLRAFTIDFFAEKCGIDKEYLETRPVRVELKQNGYLAENTGFCPVGDPYWDIQITTLVHAEYGYHGMQLDREGNLIYWVAHTARYYTTDPDVMAMGTPADPLPTDAKEETVIARCQSDLKAQYGVDDPTQYAYKAAFLKEEHFDEGRIPVWIVYISDGDGLAWKGAYSYRGDLMSLVPAKQDYLCYRTENEDFWQAAYGEQARDESVLALRMSMGKASEEECIENLLRWKDDYEAWLAEHPYSGNELDELYAQYADHFR